MKNFLLGLLVVWVWIAFVYYARQLEKRFGVIKWAEDNLGGTHQLYWLLGMLLIFIWFLIIFWVINLG